MNGTKKPDWTGILPTRAIKRRTSEIMCRDLLTLFIKNIRRFTAWTEDSTTASSGSTPTTETGAFSASFAGMKHGKKNLLFVMQFYSQWSATDYRVGVPKSRHVYHLLLDSCHGLYKRGEHAFSARSRKQECDGLPYSFAYPLPPYGVAVFRFS